MGRGSGEVTRGDDDRKGRDDRKSCDDEKHGNDSTTSQDSCIKSPPSLHMNPASCLPEIPTLPHYASSTTQSRSSEPDLEMLAISAPLPEIGSIKGDNRLATGHVSQDIGITCYRVPFSPTFPS